MVQKKKNGLILLALLCLGIMAGRLWTAAQWDTLSGDEIVYPAAGYTGLIKRTLTMNWEHPPFIKTLMAIPLLFLNVQPVPVDAFSASGTVIGGLQYGAGSDFIHKNSGVEPGTILLASRIPIMLIALTYCFLLFTIAHKRWNELIAMCALILACFSPNLLAHGHLATLDLSLSALCFLTLSSFLFFLEAPNSRSLWICGLLLGATLCCKFSGIILIPFLAGVYATWCWQRRKPFGPHLKNFGILILISYSFVILLYQYFMLEYSPAQQFLDLQREFTQTRGVTLSTGLKILLDIPFLRALLHYGLGVWWQSGRIPAISEFQGFCSFHEVWNYYPTMFLVKEPLPWLILEIFAIVIVVMQIRKCSFKEWTKKEFFVFVHSLWILFYLVILFKNSPNNTGYRHTMPLLGSIIVCLCYAIDTAWKTFNKRIVVVILSIMAAFYIADSWQVGPHYLSYFNAFAGGPSEGYKLVGDADTDWHQNARYLAQWAEDMKISEIYVPHIFQIHTRTRNDLIEAHSYSEAYRYYLGSRYRYLAPAQPVKGWIAIPARLWTWGTCRERSNDGWDSESYRWLEAYKPVANIGYSILVFHVD